MPRNHADDGQLEQQTPQFAKLRLSERDSMRVLDLLENPPEPTARLMRAGTALNGLKRGN